MSSTDIDLTWILPLVSCVSSLRSELSPNVAMFCSDQFTESPLWSLLPVSGVRPVSVCCNDNVTGDTLLSTNPTFQLTARTVSRWPRTPPSDSWAPQAVTRRSLYADLAVGRNKRGPDTVNPVLRRFRTLCKTTLAPRVDHFLY